MLSFKNPVFSEENEWRLIKGMQATNKPELLKFREINQNLIPYIETYIHVFRGFTHNLFSFFFNTS